MPLKQFLHGPGADAALTNVKVTHVGCSAHARRYFAEIHERDPDGKRIVDLYAQIYAIERRAKEACLSGAALFQHRHQLRQQHSVALMDAVHAAAVDIVRRRSGLIVTHAQYIITYRTNLRQFLDNGALPPDNNLIERLLRRNALLRKNRLHFVAEDGGIHIATALSIMGSCALLRINPIAYLHDALPALFAHRHAVEHDRARPDLTDVTPLAYAQRMQREKEQAG